MVGSKRASSKVSDLSDGLALPKQPQKEFVQYTSWPDMLRHWPKTTLCIVSNEFCERFSYYGMRTVLTFYLLSVLKFTENESTIFFNGFTVLCYSTPLLGSIIADGFIGKFWTIFSVSILYAAGQIILAIASTKDYTSHIHPGMDLAGLIIIGFGTGGIKPCVSAFGADQFELGQERMLSLYFSMFYFSINAGSMISTFISPIFRSIPCMGQDSCYPLAFGIPAILMCVATAIFMSGSFWYKKPPPKENIFGEVGRLMTHAIGNKWRAKSKKAHWLDYYMNDHNCETDQRCRELKAETGHKKACHKKKLIEDTKSLLRIIIMFLPVPMFWALYDQQGSVWLIQGIQMDCRITDTLLILPDQMQTLNAVLILIFIPLFQVIIYPLASKCIELTPLRKMVVGGLLASLAFVIAGFVQLSVNNTLPQLPNNGEVYISVWNQLYRNEPDSKCDPKNSPESCRNHTQCVVNAVINTIEVNNKNYTIGPLTASVHYNYTLSDRKDKNNKTSTLHVKYPLKKVPNDAEWKVYMNIGIIGCEQNERDYLNDKLHLKQEVKLTVKNKAIYFVGVSYNGIYQAEAKPDKPTEGTGEFSMAIIENIDQDPSYVDETHPGLNIANGWGGNYTIQNIALCRIDGKGRTEDLPCNPRRPSDFYWWENFYNPTNNSDIQQTPQLQGGNRDGKFITMLKFKPVKPGKWGLYYINTLPKDVRNKSMEASDVHAINTYYQFEIHEQGGVYVLALQGKFNKTISTEYNPSYTASGEYWKQSYQQLWQIVPSNKVNILWQIPQIVTITAAEILFSITGYEFAYSQCAPSMKAVVQALWLFTTAIGDSIIVIITVINPFSNAATEFFVYAGMMAVVIGILALLAIFYYEYHYYTLEEEDDWSDTDSSHSDEDRHIRTPPRSFAVREVGFAEEAAEEDIKF